MKYYAVYLSGLNIGSVNINMDAKIKSFDDIKKIAEYISKEYCDNKPVIILNWKKYE